MSFWEDKKVLVTGAHGFVGKNLMKLLQAMQQDVNFEILAPTRAEVDLTNEKQVAEYFWKHKPNIVLHLAGKVGGIGANKAKPADFFYQNIMMFHTPKRISGKIYLMRILLDILWQRKI